MDATQVSCPKCHTVFPLTAAIEQPIVEKFRAEFEMQAAAKERELRAREQKLLEHLATERKRIAMEQEQKAKEAVSIQLRDLQQRLSVKDAKLIEAQDAELKLRKEKAEFDEQKRAFELELARRSELIKDEIRAQKDEEFRLREAEKNKQLDDMKVQIDELKRKAEQGSQQAQGEVLELDLEAALRRCFAADDIIPVAKGSHGGDLLQRVRDETGHDCGTIIWESKRTKCWSDGWLAKLKDDQREAKAQLAILVSTVMPRDVASFECRENVWIAPTHLAVPLAGALRLALVDLAAAKRAIDGRHDKMSIVYDYVSGPEFRVRVTAIVEAFKCMREDLEKEKSAMQRIWTKREKQIERVLLNASGMHGELSAIIGKAMPVIQMLELDALPEPTEESASIAIDA